MRLFPVVEHVSFIHPSVGQPSWGGGEDRPGQQGIAVTSLLPDPTHLERRENFYPRCVNISPGFLTLLSRCLDLAKMYEGANGVNDAESSVFWLVAFWTMVGSLDRLIQSRWIGEEYERF